MTKLSTMTNYNFRVLGNYFLVLKLKEKTFRLL